MGHARRSRGDSGVREQLAGLCDRRARQEGAQCVLSIYAFKTDRSPVWMRKGGAVGEDRPKSTVDASDSAPAPAV